MTFDKRIFEDDPINDPLKGDDIVNVPINVPLNGDDTVNVPINDPLKGDDVVNVPINVPLNGDDTVNVPINNLEDELLTILKNRNGVSGAELAKITEKNYRTRKRYLELFKEAGIVEHRGSKKTGGYYIINDNINDK